MANSWCLSLHPSLSLAPVDSRADSLKVRTVEPVCGSLTFRDAIKAHAQWKLRLELYLSGDSSEQLDPATVRRDDLCALGQWIHSPTTTVADQTEFFALKDTHAKFHRAVSAIIKAAQRGLPDPSAIEAGSEYASLSLSIITQLKNMQRRLGIE